MNYRATGFLLVYRARESIASLTPTRGPERGGTSVTLLGASFLDLPDTAACKFGAAVAPVFRYLNASAVVCLSAACDTPALCGLGVDVYVSSNGQDWSAADDKIRFVYTSLPTVQTLKPSTGSMAGLTKVSVAGTNFGSSVGGCVFGSASVPATIMSTTWLQCLSPQGAEGVVTFEVLEGDDDTTSSGLLFQYTVPVAVTDVRPSHGPASGGTSFSVIGSNFYASTDGLQCALGGDVVKGLLVSSSVVRCVAPPGERGAVALQLSNNGGTDYYGAGLRFLYTPPLALEALSVSHGPESGGNTLEVYGIGFHRDAALACRFASALARVDVSAQFRSASHVSCAAPAHSPGAVQLSVTSNGVDFSAAALAYTYDALLRLHTLVPSRTAAGGGAVVTVLGESFAAGTAAACRFGGTEARATVLSSSAVTCLAPPLAPGEHAVSASSNGVDFSPDALRLAVLAEAAVTALAPTGGPSAGGAVVTVTGASFAAGEARCCFDASACTLADVVSSSRMLCVAPAHAAGNVPLVLWGNAVSSHATAFEYSSVPAVLSLLPSSAAVTGGALVTVSGAGFDRLHAVSCRFGCCDIVAARFLSSTRVLCAAPAGHADAVAVEASNDGTHFSSSGVLFEFVEPPLLLSVTPTRGAAGLPVLVTVSGLHFSGSVTACRFAGLGSTDVTLLSSSLATCLTPAAAEGATTLQLLGANDEAFDGGAAFAFSRGPVITAVQPAIVYGDGGRRVTLLGAAFSEDLSTCRFGAAETAGTFVSESKVVCQTPPAAAGVVALEIGSAAVSSAAATQIAVQSLPSVASANPSVSSDAGGQTVTVFGVAFSGAGAATCRFGKGEGDAAVAASFVTSTALVCATPARLPGTVALQVSNNGVDFSADSVPFEFDLSATVGSVAPSRAPRAGGTAVTLLGANFPPSGGAFFCTFGSAPAVAATSVDANRIVCVTPEAPATGAISLRVSARGFSQVLPFEVFSDVKVSRVDPASGPVSGGANVHISGDFAGLAASDLGCRFEGAPAYRVRSAAADEIVCVAPALPAGLVAADVLTSDGVVVASFYFRYVAAFEVGSFAPHAGPETGGTVVTITGSFPASSCFCMFGTAPPQPCLSVSEAAVTCITSAHAPKVVLLRVSPDKTSYTNVGTFRFIPAATLARVAPTAGTCDGRTPVTVHGAGFLSGAPLLCAFDGDLAAATPAAVTRADLASCALPAQAAGTHVLSLAGAVSPVPVHFLCAPAPAALLLAPSSGPVAGGTSVLVSGVGFGGVMQCRFAGAAEVPATVTSSTALRCAAPASAPGKAAVEVGRVSSPAFAGGFGAATRDFLYEHEAVVSEIEPSYGHVAAAGQVATVLGEHFEPTDAVSCHFGAERVRALFLSSSALACAVPALAADGAVSIAVSNNGETPPPPPSY